MSGTARDLLRAAASELRRTNYAGRTVTLAEGAAVCLGVTALAALRGRRADALVLAGVGVIGLADDLVEHRERLAGRPVAKGLRGHLGALRHGRLTTGGAKALGIPALCLLGAASAPRPRHPLQEAVLAAGLANLMNLLDLRPGRALKAVLVPAALLTALPASGPAGAPGGERDASGRELALAAVLPAALALPSDLTERGMLGDAGANILGAATGLALARRAGGPVRLLCLAGVIALTLASERVSFSAVIARTPVLAALDQLGRRPAPRRADGPAA